MKIQAVKLAKPFSQIFQDFHILGKCLPIMTKRLNSIKSNYTNHNNIFFSVIAVIATSAEASKHLDMGKQMLAAGNMIEALSHFDIAVGKLNNNKL